MIEKVKALTSEINGYFRIHQLDDVEQFRLKFIGRNNLINDLFDEFKTVAPEEKRILGPALNELKEACSN